LKGLNIVGLKRRGIENKRIHVLRDAYRDLFANIGTLRTRLDVVCTEHCHEPLVQMVTDFIRTSGERGICVPQKPPHSYHLIRSGSRRLGATVSTAARVCCALALDCQLSFRIATLSS
jgi:hypothetical protein